VAPTTLTAVSAIDCVYVYPSTGEAVVFDTKVLGSHVCPTVGAYWLLATEGIGMMRRRAQCAQDRCSLPSARLTLSVQTWPQNPGPPPSTICLESNNTSPPDARLSAPRERRERYNRLRAPRYSVPHHATTCMCETVPGRACIWPLQGYLAHKKHSPPRTLQ
jgi:hypothetical protein